MRRWLVLVAVLVASVTPAAAATSVADLENFYKRLESIGLDTKYIRALGGSFKAYFSLFDDGDPPAAWSVVTKKLDLHNEIKEKSSNKVLFDVDINGLNTLIHEFSHAEYSMRLKGGALEPSVTGAAGSPEKGHYDLWRFWKDEQRRSFWYSWSNLAAEELCGYFMGTNYDQLFRVADRIILYNLASNAEIEATYGGDLLKLQDEIVLPPENPTGRPQADAAQLKPAFVFGQQKPFDPQFSNKPIQKWTEPKPLMLEMYKNSLGLKPPATTGDLLEKLNTIRNPWIDQKRLAILNSRLGYKKKPGVTSLPGTDTPRKRVSLPGR